MQSESGYIGRRARVAASMIHTNVGLETVSTREVSNDVALGVSTASVTVTRGTSGGYGNPAIRVISKLTAGIMQEMLTVKVATQPPSGSMGGSAAPGVSPVMDVLMGCNNTMVMCRSGSGSSGRTLRVLRDVNDRSLKSGEALEGLLLEDITASYSPVLLRHIEAGDRRVAVAKEGLSMVLHCARRSVDVTEFHAILCMLMSAVERGGATPLCTAPWAQTLDTLDGYRHVTAYTTALGILAMGSVWASITVRSHYRKVSCYAITAGLGPLPLPSLAFMFNTLAVSKTPSGSAQTHLIASLRVAEAILL